jgi:hypothetical protein
MKAILQLVAKLGDSISNILAVTCLLPGGWDYNSEPESSHCISVSDGDNARVLCVNEEIVLTCAEAPNDKISLNLVHQPTPGLAAVLQAIGMGAQTWTIDLEHLDDRLCAVDHAWQLMRNIALAKPSLPTEKRVEHAMALLEFAHKWRAACAAVLNTGSEAASTAVANLETQARQMTAVLSDVLSSLTLNYDARGSAMTVQFVDRDHTTEVCGHAFNWSPARAPLGSNGQASAAMHQVVPTQASHPVKPSKIDDAVRNILAGAEIEGHEVRIHERLLPAAYKKVSTWLEEAGGHWHVGRQAHVFSTDPSPILNQMIHAGVWYTRKDFEFFWTPPSEVAELVRALYLAPGMQVMEPEAGHGAIAMAMAEVVGIENVHCYELMPENVAHLARLGFSINAAQDFLSVQPDPAMDAVALNPPFSGGRDIAHVLHAVKFLKPGGRLAAIMSPTWLQADTRKAESFRKFLSEHDAQVTKISAGTFKDAGTNIETVRVVLKMPAQVITGNTRPKTETKHSGATRKERQIEQLSLI